LLDRARSRWAAATILCVTHDIAETRDFARVLVVEGGRIVEDGAPLALANDPASRYTAFLEADARVKRRVWSSTGQAAWRRLRLEGGRLSEASEVDP